jgi:hypothetical protein
MPDSLLFEFFGLHVNTSGQVSFIVASAVSLFIVALAWRVVR